MLIDQADGGLYTGDTLYPGALYAHLNSSEYEIIPTYCDTMQRLQHLTSVVKKIFPSHNLPVYPADLLTRAAAKFLAIHNGESKGEAYGNGLLMHADKDFSVLVKAEYLRHM
jgi:glyoxylase-like metal-dependent hydrolase (beta-lactamase superfamily II)